MGGRRRRVWIAVLKRKAEQELEIRERNRTEAIAEIKLQELAADWVLEARGGRTEGQKLRIWGWKCVESEMSAGNPDSDLEGMEGQSWRWRLGNHPHSTHCWSLYIPKWERKVHSWKAVTGERTRENWGTVKGKKRIAREYNVWKTRKKFQEERGNQK